MDEKDDRSEPLRAAPDLAGTNVFDADGHHVGCVFSTLAEVESGLMRYLDIALLDAPRHVIVPIGHTRIDDKGSHVEIQLRAATARDLEQVPAFESGTSICMIEDENALLADFGRAFCGERYYAHPAYDHGGLFIGQQAVLRTGTPAGDHRAFELLSTTSDMELSPGQPNIVGFDVVDAHAQPIGRVADLVLDYASESVPYIVVQLNDGDTRLVPAGYAARVNDSRIRLEGLTAEDVHALPAWPVEELTRAREEALRLALESRLDGARRSTRADFRRRAA